MQNKSYLKLYAYRIYLFFKSMGFYALFSVIVLNVLLPIINYLTYKKLGGTFEFELRLLMITLITVPFFSVWWNIVLLKNFTQANSCESLCFYRHFLRESIVVFCISIIDISVLYFFYSLVLPNMFFEFLRMVCICTLFFGLTFFTTRLFKVITAPIMTNFVYTAINVVIIEKYRGFPLYFNTEFITSKLFFIQYIPLFLVGVTLVFISTRIKKLP